MEIRYLPRDEEPNLMDLLRDGAIHYVSIAMPGLTNAGAYMEFAGGFSVEEKYGIMNGISAARETGTLYPKVNITLLPSPVCKDRFGLASVAYQSRDYPRPQVIEHLQDAFKANRDFIKSATMYFDFRYLSVSEELYLSCLQEVLRSTEDPVLQDVISWQSKK